MKTEKFNSGNRVTISFDRSSKVDSTVILSRKREDLEKEWEKLDGIEVEVWEDTKGYLFSRSKYQNSKAQFIYEPDFN